MATAWYTPGAAPSGAAATPATGNKREPSWADTVLQTGQTLGQVTNGVSLQANMDYPRDNGANQTLLRWRERVENYSPWNDVFSCQQQEANLVVDVPFDNRYLFLTKVLGYQYVSSSMITRVNPMPHPYWTWLRAARLGHAGVRFEGSKVYVNSGRVARYRLARFNIGYANYPMTFLEDNQCERPGGEWQRNTVWEESPTSQFIAAEGGNALLKYPYTTAGGPSAGNAFRAPFGAIASQIRYTLTWKWVPYDYVVLGRIPKNLYRALNKVNEVKFFHSDPDFTDGFPPGTLLFEGCRIVKYPAPFRFTTAPALLCDISLSFLYFDPERGIEAGDGSTIRGHNLVPFRTNHKWYPATRDDLAPGATNQLFQPWSFAQIFTKPTP